MPARRNERVLGSGDAGQICAVVDVRPQALGPALWGDVRAQRRRDAGSEHSWRSAQGGRAADGLSARESLDDEHRRTAESATKCGWMGLARRVRFC